MRPAVEGRTRVLAEAMEARRLLSISTDAAGFTVVTPPRDAHVIYVSSSTGDDDNGGSASSPLKTLHAAASRLRNGSGDQMLLKRGDVWRESLGQWRKGGDGEGAPMVIGAYGAGDRPRLDTGADTGLLLGAWSDVHHVAVIGLHFNADARDPASARFSAEGAASEPMGIQVTNGTDDILIEDCVVEHYATNVIAMSNSGGDVRRLTIRRSQVRDAYSTTDRHSQGLYAEGVRGLTLEENVFDHNGWNEDVPGATATNYNHNVYLAAENDNVVVRGNLIADASGHGLQARAGGTVEDNVFLNNPTAMSYGLVRGQRDPLDTGVSGVVNGNVFLGTRDIDGAKRGAAIEVANTKPGTPTVLSNNIFSHDDRDGGGFPAITLVYPDEGGVGLNDLSVQGNVVYRWSNALYVQADVEPGGTGLRALNRLAIRDNDFVRIEDGQIVRHDGKLDPGEEQWSGNRYDGDGWKDGWVTVEYRPQAFDRWADRVDDGARATRPAFADAGRTAGTYNESLSGVGSAEAYVAEARKQSSESWRPEYATAALVQYMRDGFAEPSRATPRSWAAPTAPAAVANVPADGITVTTEQASVDITVTYTDDKQVDVDSLGDGDVRLVSREEGGRSLPAALVSVDDPTGDGTGPVMATYRIAAPDGVWRRADRGRYRVVVQPNEVRDTANFVMGGGPVGQGSLEVLKAPDPPRVAKLKVRAGKGPNSVTVKFVGDVAASLRAGRLTLTTDDGQSLDPATMAVAWDAKANAATWTFPGLADGRLPAGRYRLTLSAAEIADASGRHLDGNRDGIAGDDFTAAKTFKVKG